MHKINFEVSAIFPKIDSRVIWNERANCWQVDYGTQLRVPHEDGTYYLVLLISTEFVDRVEDTQNCLLVLIKNVYLSTLFYKISPNLKDSLGNNIYIKDVDQTDERERIKKAFKIFPSR